MGRRRRKCVVDEDGVPRVVVCSDRQRLQWGLKRSCLLASAVVLLSTIAYPIIHPGDVGLDTPQSIFRPEVLAASIPLKPVADKHTASNCSGFGMAEDHYFHRNGGRHCRRIRFQPKQHLSKMMRQAELVIKAFDSEELCSRYFEFYWGAHLRYPIHRRFYSEVTTTTPPLGDDFHAMLWDPASRGASDGRVPHLPPPTQEYAQKHIAFIFRKGRLFVLLIASGHTKKHNPLLSPEALHEVAATLNGHIHDVAPSRAAQTLRGWRDSIVASIASTGTISWIVYAGVAIVLGLVSLFVVAARAGVQGFVRPALMLLPQPLRSMFLQVVARLTGNRRRAHMPPSQRRQSASRSHTRNSGPSTGASGGQRNGQKNRTRMAGTPAASGSCNLEGAVSAQELAGSEDGSLHVNTTLQHASSTGSDKTRAPPGKRKSNSRRKRRSRGGPKSDSAGENRQDSNSNRSTLGNEGNLPAKQPAASCTLEQQKSNATRRSSYHREPGKQTSPNTAASATSSTAAQEMPHVALLKEQRAGGVRNVEEQAADVHNEASEANSVLEEAATRRAAHVESERKTTAPGPKDKGADSVATTTGDNRAGNLSTQGCVSEGGGTSCGTARTRVDAAAKTNSHQPHTTPHGRDAAASDNRPARLLEHKGQVQRDPLKRLLTENEPEPPQRPQQQEQQKKNEAAEEGKPERQEKEVVEKGKQEKQTEERQKEERQRQRQVRKSKKKKKNKKQKMQAQDIAGDKTQGQIRDQPHAAGQPQAHPRQRKHSDTQRLQQHQQQKEQPAGEHKQRQRPDVKGRGGFARSRGDSGGATDDSGHHRATSSSAPRRSRRGSRRAQARFCEPASAAAAAAHHTSHGAAAMHPNAAPPHLPSFSIGGPPQQGHAPYFPQQHHQRMFHFAHYPQRPWLPDPRAGAWVVPPYSPQAGSPAYAYSPQHGSPGFVFGPVGVAHSPVAPFRYDSTLPSGTAAAFAGEQQTPHQWQEPATCDEGHGEDAGQSAADEHEACDSGNQRTAPESSPTAHVQEGGSEAGREDVAKEGGQEERTEGKVEGEREEGQQEEAEKAQGQGEEQQHQLHEEKRQQDLKDQEQPQLGQHPEQDQHHQHQHHQHHPHRPPVVFHFPSHVQHQPVQQQYYHFPQQHLQPYIQRQQFAPQAPQMPPMHRPLSGFPHGLPPGCVMLPPPTPFDEPLVYPAAMLRSLVATTPLRPNIQRIVYSALGEPLPPDLDDAEGGGGGGGSHNRNAAAGGDSVAGTMAPAEAGTAVYRSAARRPDIPEQAGPEAEERKGKANAGEEEDKEAAQRERGEEEEGGKRKGAMEEAAQGGQVVAAQQQQQQQQQHQETSRQDAETGSRSTSFKPDKEGKGGSQAHAVSSETDTGRDGGKTIDEARSGLPVLTRGTFKDDKDDATDRREGKTPGQGECGSKPKKEEMEKKEQQAEETGQSSNNQGNASNHKTGPAAAAMECHMMEKDRV